MSGTYIGKPPALSFGLEEKSNLLYEDTLSSADRQFTIPDIFNGSADGVIIEVDFITSSAASAGTSTRLWVNGDTTTANYIYQDHWVTGTTQNASASNGNYLGWVLGDAMTYKAIIDVSLVERATAGTYHAVINGFLTGGEPGVLAMSQAITTTVHESVITGLTSLQFYVDAAGSMEANARIRVWSKTADVLVASAHNAGKNIVFNSDFAINQRGYVDGTAPSLYNGAYDRWLSGSAGSTMSVSGIVCTLDNTTASTNGAFYQGWEADTLVAGEYYTVSWEGSAEVSVSRAASGWKSNTFSFIAPSGVDGNGRQEILNIRGDGATISKLKVERGRVATPWERPDKATELARCQRYYYELASNNPGTSASVVGAYNTASYYYFIATHPVEMRTIPTSDWKSGGSSWSGGNPSPKHTAQHARWERAGVFSTTYTITFSAEL